jgi:hypothetical protein
MFACVTCDNEDVQAQQEGNSDHATHNSRPCRTPEGRVTARVWPESPVSPRHEVLVLTFNRVAESQDAAPRLVATRPTLTAGLDLTRPVPSRPGHRLGVARRCSATRPTLAPVVPGVGLPAGPGRRIRVAQPGHQAGCRPLLSFQKSYVSVCTTRPGTAIRVRGCAHGRAVAAAAGLPPAPRACRPRRGPAARADGGPRPFAVGSARSGLRNAPGAAGRDGPGRLARRRASLEPQRAGAAAAPASLRRAPRPPARARPWLPRPSCTPGPDGRGGHGGHGGHGALPSAAPATGDVVQSSEATVMDVCRLYVAT